MRSFPIGFTRFPWSFVSGLWSLVPGLWSLVPGLWSLVSGLWDQKNIFLRNITILFVFIGFCGADASFTLNQAWLGGVKTKKMGSTKKWGVNKMSFLGSKKIVLPNITILFVFIGFRGADASFTLNQAGLGDGDLRRDTRERRPAPFGDQTFVFSNISKLWFS